MSGLMVKQLQLRPLVLTVLGLYFAGSLTAQKDVDTTTLVGNWAYSLGPKTLFGLHLERDPIKPNQLHGYVMLPEDFNVNSQNGTRLQFSNISSKGEQHPVASFAWQNGALQLRSLSPAQGGSATPTYSVTPIDNTNVDFTLFLSFANLRMKRITGVPQLAPDWDSKRTYTQDDFALDNDDMTAIVARDQADRAGTSHLSQQALDEGDSKRRVQTAALLQQGLLHTGPDFDHAALVFQHGTTSNDYLLAHVLAVIAISKGQSGAVWISAATLDRYLQSLHQPQIFGTQYKTLNKDPSTQEPYDRSLISDALRAYMEVPDQAVQEAQRREYDVRRGVSTTARPTLH